MECPQIFWEVDVYRERVFSRPLVAAFLMVAPPLGSRVALSMVAPGHGTCSRLQDDLGRPAAGRGKAGCLNDLDFSGCLNDLDLSSGGRRVDVL